MMKFDTIDLVRKRDDYIKAFKKILGEMKEGELTPFWYYDGVKVDGNDASVVVLGKVKPDVLKTLKGEAATKGEGNCFREGNVLKMTLAQGKMPELKLKDLFRETKNYGFALVESDLAPGDQSGPGVDAPSKVKEIIANLMDRFDAAKGQISDDNRKTLRMKFDAIEKAGADEDISKLNDLVAGFDKAMAAFLDQAGKGATREPGREEKQALDRLAAAQGRFDKAKARLTDDERKEVRKSWEAVETAREAGDWPGLVKAVAVAEAQLLATLKQALQGEEAAKGRTAQDLAGKVGALADKVRGDIATQTDKVDQLLGAMNPERAKMQKILDALLVRRRRNVDADGKALPPTPEITTLLGHLTASKTALEAAEKVLEPERKKLDDLRKALAKINMDTDPESVRALERAEQSMASLEKLIDDTPFSVAQAAISGTVEEMAEATKWHEEQIRRESEAEAAGAPIKPHIAGRHGPQTGLGRQGRRAGTQAHVTPDQPGNNAGAPQLVAWNKVEISYTEQDGKRVVKDRVKVAQALVDQMTRAGGGNAASIWGTPVLEKEAVDRASDYARRLKGFTHYVSNQGANPFVALTVLLGKPAKQPGWGYGVKNTNGSYVTPATADDILKRFEAGEITQDEMLKDMDVELKATDGGVDMIEYCRLIFKRTSNAADWTLLTGYPDAAVTHEGFSPHSAFPANLRLQNAAGIQTFDAKNLGAIP